MFVSNVAFKPARNLVLRIWIMTESITFNISLSLVPWSRNDNKCGKFLSLSFKLVFWCMLLVPYWIYFNSSFKPSIQIDRVRMYAHSTLYNKIKKREFRLSRSISIPALTNLSRFSSHWLFFTQSSSHTKCSPDIYSNICSTSINMYLCNRAWKKRKKIK